MFEIIGRALAAFNSKARPWQISLAAALALIPGLSPFFAIHNVLILFLAFFLNINLGIFIVALAIFSGIAWMVDPWMEVLGYWILTQPSLESLFTSWYNSAWMGLTRFNNSLVIGSLAASLLLFPLVWLLLHLTINLYRGPISRLTDRVPVVRLFLAYDSKLEELKKPFPVRWIGAGIYVGIIGGISVFVLLFLDPIVKKGLEIGLSRSAGAEVEIASLQTSLNPLTLEIHGLQIPDKTDLMRNLAQAERIAFEVDLGHLFHRRFLLDELVATAVVLDQPRQSPARIHEVASPPPAEPQPSTPRRFVADASERLPEPREVVRQETLHTRTEGERIERELQQVEQKWSGQEIPEPDLSQYRDRLRQLEQQARNIRSEDDLRKVRDEARALRSDLRQYVDDYERLLDELTADRRSVRQLVDELRGLPGEDFNALRDKYSLDMDGAFELAGTLLGEDVQENLDSLREWYYRLLPYVDMARERMARRGEHDDTRPPRGEGRIVHYTLWDPKPGWLIAHAALDITTGSGNKFAGELKGLTDNQRITGEPMRAWFQSQQVSGYDSLRIDWLSERRQDEPRDTFDIALRGYEKSGSRVDRLFMSPSELRSDLQLELTSGGQLSGGGVLNFANVELGLEHPGNELERVIHRTLASVQQFDVDLRLTGRITSPRARLGTDLDRQLSNRFRDELEEQRRQFEQRLRAELEKLAQEYMEKAGLKQEELEQLQALLRGEADALQALEERVGRELSEDALRGELQQRLDEERQRLEEERRRLEEEARQRAEEERRRLEEEKQQREQELRDQLRDEGERLLRGLR